MSVAIKIPTALRRVFDVEAEDAFIEKRFAETNTNFEKRLAEYHSSLLRWMFAFFIGNIVTMLSFLLTYMQIIKP